MRVEGKLSFADFLSDEGKPIFAPEVDATVVSVDLWKLLWNGEVRSGGYRVTFLPNCLPGIAIKIEKNPEVIQNCLEWEHYSFSKQHYEEHCAKFMAPVTGLSPNRRILIQTRVDRELATCDFCRPDLRSTKVPAWFIMNDAQICNFGFIGKQLVCLDYGFVDVAAYMRDPHIPFDDFAKYILHQPYIDRTLGHHDKPKSDCKPPTYHEFKALLDNPLGLAKSKSSQRQHQRQPSQERSTQRL